MSKGHPAVLTKNKYGVCKKELLKACVSREFLLMKRNSFVYIFKMWQLILTGFITMTLFLRTEMHRDIETDGGIYMGALFFILIVIMYNGYSELSVSIMKLPVFYKQSYQGHHFLMNWLKRPWPPGLPSFHDIFCWLLKSSTNIGSNMACCTTRQSDINLVEMDSDVVKDEDIAVLLEGGALQS